MDVIIEVNGQYLNVLDGISKLIGNTKNFVKFVFVFHEKWNENADKIKAQFYCPDGHIEYLDLSNDGEYYLYLPNISEGVAQLLLYIDDGDILWSTFPVSFTIENSSYITPEQI